MGLVCTEIHIKDKLPDNRIVFFADRRISVGGRYNNTRCKIFQIPYLNAGIGYFGIAGIKQKDKTKYLDDWVRLFINRNSKLKNIEEFAHELASQLEKWIPESEMYKQVSGIHIAGFNSDKLPEFWFIRNFKEMEGQEYKDFQTNYIVGEQFLLHYGPKDFAFDIKCKCFWKKGILTLRNGDFRAHIIAWEKLDSILEQLLSFKDFRKPVTDEDYEDVVKFKMNIICNLYKKFCTNSIIGTPIDIFTIKPKP